MSTDTKPKNKPATKNKQAPKGSQSQGASQSSSKSKSTGKTPAKTRGKKSKKAKTDRVILILSIVSTVSVVALAFTVGYLMMNGKEQHVVDQPLVVSAVSHDSIRSDIESYLFRRGITLVNSDPTYNPLAKDSSPGLLKLAGATDPLLIEQELDQLLQRVSSDVWIDSSGLPSRLGVYYQSTEVVVLQFANEPKIVADPVVPVSTSSSLPRIAIVIDDIGRDVRAAQALLANGMEVTFSILPNTENATRIAHLVHESGREVFLHLPMEPQGYPEKNPGYDSLLVGASAERIQDLLEMYLKIVPFAIGGNNHMGSRFTEDVEGMDEVLTYFANENLIFLDSLTSSESIVVERANAHSVPVKKRDVFLDNVQDVQAIRDQIAKVVRIAERKGEAIAIGHPYPETIEALRLEFEEGLQDRVEVVPVSTLF